VRIEVINALVAFGDLKCRPALRRALDRELDGRVARRLREALRDLGDTTAERKRVADDLENVRNELAELKARLAKIETTTKPARAHRTNAELTESKPRARARPRVARPAAAKAPAKRAKPRKPVKRR